MKSLDLIKKLGEDHFIKSFFIFYSIMKLILFKYIHILSYLFLMP